MSVISVTSVDPILHVLAPISLAAAAGTALVIDRDPRGGWPFPVGSLDDLAEAGPSAAELHPARPGVALIGGPVSHGEAAEELIEAFRVTWPAVVVRVPAGEPGAVRIDPALPWPTEADVVVHLGWVRAAAAIPAPPRRLLRRVLGGTLDSRWRWFRHWRPVWDHAQ